MLNSVINAFIETKKCALFKLTLTCDWLLPIFNCPDPESNLKIVSAATKLPKLLFTFFTHVLLLLHIRKITRFAFLFKDCFYFTNFDIVFGAQKINNIEHNVHLLNCLLLCARLYIDESIIYRCKYGNRIPTASEFYQRVQKVKLSEFILSKNHNKIIFFRKKQLMHL